jgi:hypothetical protein
MFQQHLWNWVGAVPDWGLMRSFRRKQPNKTEANIREGMQNRSCILPGKRRGFLALSNEIKAQQAVA